MSLNMRRHLASEAAMNVDSHSPLRLSYGLLMDGVQPLRNMTETTLSLNAAAGASDVDEDAVISWSRGRTRRSSARVSLVPGYISVYPDPELDSFTGIKQFYFTKNEYLHLSVSLMHCMFIC